jgi:cell division protein FtsN
MANTGRSTYEPPDDIHVFDGAEDDDDVEGSRLPLLIVIALFVLAAFAGVVYLAYTQGVARGRSDVPRIIAAQPGPAKVAAKEDSDAPSFKGLKIYQQPAPSDEAADRQVTPPPPAPDQSQTVEPETAPITSNVEAPAKAEAAPPKAALSKTEAAPPKTETPTAKEPPLSVAKSLSPPAAPPVAKAEPKVVPEPKAVKAAPPPAPAKVATAEPTPLVKSSAATGAYVLQIGAYKSEADADAAWRAYHAKHASALGSYSQDVKKVDLGAKGTWYRLRVGSFADKDAAKALCTKLAAEGGACFPAK